MFSARAGVSGWWVDNRWHKQEQAVTAAAAAAGVGVGGAVVCAVFVVMVLGTQMLLQHLFPSTAANI